MTSERIRDIAEWLWENDTNNLYIGHTSENHWVNLSEDRRQDWYDKADLMMEWTGLSDDLRSAQREIDYWTGQFNAVLKELKGTYVNVYNYTIGREPSPYEWSLVQAHIAERSDG